MRNKILMVLVVVGSLALSAVAPALGLNQQEGVPFHPPVAELPRHCQGLWARFTCQSDADFEYALEQEYWGIVGNGDFDQMPDWHRKTSRYLSAVSGLGDKERARLETLMAFGYVGRFVQSSAFDPFNLANVIQAKFWSTRAMRRDPDSPNLQSLDYYLDAYLAYALGDTAAGDQAIGRLYGITEQYGEIHGSEGQLVGAMGQMFLRDQSQVAIGLATLDNCNTVPCQRPSPLAPYKEVGMQLAIAEGYARLGDLAAMEAAYDRARTYALEHSMPTPEIIEASYDQMTAPGGTIEGWETMERWGLGLGDIQLPLPPSGGAMACQSCHVTGSQPVNHFAD